MCKEFCALYSIYTKKDFKISFSLEDIKEKICNFTDGENETYSKILALSSAILSINPKFPDNKEKSFDEKAFAIAGEKKIAGKREFYGQRKLIHPFKENDEPEYWNFIKRQREIYLDKFAIWTPILSQNDLPLNSFFLQFQFTLAKPFISCDDESYYIIENPVRKDKVFKVPMMSPAGWKGNLRWVATRQAVLECKQNKDSEKFAEKRFRLTLLFGDEKGEGENKALAKYLDDICKDAAKLYRQKVKEYFQSDNENLPNHKGRLYFYSTFFNQIDLEVINPHDRKTRAGIKPIYFEVVPDGAEGYFSLLWFPFDCIVKGTNFMEQMQKDWKILEQALREMFLTYGFSAKKTSGYGVIKNEIKEAKFLIGGTNLKIDSGDTNFDTFFEEIETKIGEVKNG